MSVKLSCKYFHCLPLHLCRNSTSWWNYTRWLDLTSTLFFFHNFGFNFDLVHLPALQDQLYHVMQTFPERCMLTFNEEDEELEAEARFTEEDEELRTVASDILSSLIVTCCCWILCSSFSSLTCSRWHVRLLIIFLPNVINIQFEVSNSFIFTTKSKSPLFAFLHFSLSCQWDYFTGGEQLSSSHFFCSSGCKCHSSSFLPVYFVLEVDLGVIWCPRLGRVTINVLHHVLLEDCLWYKITSNLSQLFSIGFNLLMNASTRSEALDIRMIVCRGIPNIAFKSN